MEENTQQQQEENVETVAKAEYDAMVAERDELLQYKPEELTDEEVKAQQDREAFEKEKLEFAIEKAGLSEFAEFINDQEEIEAFQGLVKKIQDNVKKELAYKPENHKQTDEYSQFAQKGDTKGMIGSKLAGLFK
ncbi:hypothetical protein LAV77_04995 [Priestia megaterium]|uniref:hypothetical protein n=1 Tax=Priestia megaterium TaxID=1404 RepID=UPI002B25507E|nr:hypothetical protein [Priestia megaterium]MEB2264151.1 hypothetical protein [Priestia megaterium]